MRNLSENNQKTSYGDLQLFHIVENLGFPQAANGGKSHQKGRKNSKNSQVLLSFPLERPLFLREYTSNMYSTIPYGLAKAFVEIPIVLVQQTITVSIMYPIIGFNAPYIMLIVASAMLALAAATASIAEATIIFHRMIAKNENPR